MDQPAIEKSSNAPKRWNIPGFFMPIFRYVIAGGCLLWVFYDIHPGRLLDTLFIRNWLWIPLAVFFQLSNFCLQGMRWKFLLYPLGNLSWFRTTQAVFAGQFTNGIFPMRIGELVRAYLVSRWLKGDFVAVLPSIWMEFLFDCFWLAVGIGTAAILIPLPSALLNAIFVLVVFVIFMIALFAFIVFWERKIPHKHHATASFIERIWNKAYRLLHRLLDGLQGIGFSGHFFGALMVSLFLLLAQTLAFWLVMEACGLHLSLWRGAVVYLIVHLGTMLPNAPSNVGTYQFFTVLGLSLFGVDKSIAAGFSIVVFVALTVPLLLVGFFALHQTGLSQKKIREDMLENLNR
jgi:glycosyltransferase 2 family protein